MQEPREPRRYALAQDRLGEGAKSTHVHGCAELNPRGTRNLTKNCFEQFDTILSYFKISGPRLGQVGGYVYWGERRGEKPDEGGELGRASRSGSGCMSSRHACANAHGVRARACVCVFVCVTRDWRRHWQHRAALAVAKRAGTKRKARVLTVHAKLIMRKPRSLIKYSWTSQPGI